MEAAKRIDKEATRHSNVQYNQPHQNKASRGVLHVSLLYYIIYFDLYCDSYSPHTRVLLNCSALLSTFVQVSTVGGGWTNKTKLSSQFPCSGWIGVVGNRNDINHGTSGVASATTAR